MYNDVVSLSSEEDYLMLYVNKIEKYGCFYDSNLNTFQNRILKNKIDNLQKLSAKFDILQEYILLDDLQLRFIEELFEAKTELLKIKNYDDF